MASQKKGQWDDAQYTVYNPLPVNLTSCGQEVTGMRQDYTLLDKGGEIKSSRIMKITNEEVIRSLQPQPLPMLWTQRRVMQ